ncbi:hypothetical protein PENTCL1PPCAC_21048, partial [Pristionchus entomophagus]
YLCNAWLVGYLALFSGSIALWIVSMRDENGYLAQSWKSPPHRLLLYEICTACSLFCTVSEIAIAVERIVSIKDPEKYHNMPISTGVLATFSVSLVQNPCIVLNQFGSISDSILLFFRNNRVRI